MLNYLKNCMIDQNHMIQWLNIMRPWGTIKMP
jgi:hypothetical protein